MKGDIKGGFGSIQNNIALKQVPLLRLKISGFGSIQNNIALKQQNGVDKNGTEFW